MKKYPKKIKGEYPDLTDEDIHAVLKFAAHTIEFEEVEKTVS